MGKRFAIALGNENRVIPKSPGALFLVSDDAFDSAIEGGQHPVALSDREDAAKASGTRLSPGSKRGEFLQKLAAENGGTYVDR